MVRNRFIRTALFSLPLLAALVFAAGCSDSDSATAKVAGTWVITQNFNTGTVKTIEMTLTQSGENVGGTSDRGPVQGTVKGTAIDFTLDGEDLKTFSGTVTGDSMAGSFNENFENSLFREGTWTAVRM